MNLLQRDFHIYIIYKALRLLFLLALRLRVTRPPPKRPVPAPGTEGGVVGAFAAAVDDVDDVDDVEGAAGAACVEGGEGVDTDP